MLTETQIDIRYPDCDAMGIVHHAVYPVWYEIARMDFFQKSGFSYTDMNAMGINPPMVNLNLNYYAPVRYPGSITIRTSCSLCQGKKLELRYAIYSGTSTTPVATATSFHIWTGPDMKSLDMRTVPQVYEKLQAAHTKPAVLILAGGKSTRMGCDKATLLIDNESLLERAVRYWRTALPAATIYLASGAADHFSSLPEGVVQIIDNFAGIGPMGGIEAALRSTGASELFISAVDMPLLTEPLFDKLRSGATGCEDACIFKINGNPEPLFGIYRSSILPLIDQQLRLQNYRMSDLLKQAKTTYVKLTDKTALTNTNTPEEFRQICSHS